MDEIQKFLAVLPVPYQELIEDFDSLVEIILDLGKPLLFRYQDYKVKIQDVIVNKDLINHAISKVGPFGNDNRAGIDGTLHRISRILNRNGEIIGLTCRVGRAFEGTIDLIKDLVFQGENILLVGKPGSGKTTLLRTVARVLSSDFNRNVVIVDSSNEIAGDGDITHPAVGESRRLQVPSRLSQHDVMIEAVQNHTPDVVIVDEIGTGAEADAARTISQRGVQLIATAHGNSLSDVIENPPLMPLVGSIKAVAVSDAKAEKDGTGKMPLVRLHRPVFSVLIELTSFDEILVYSNVQEAVDAILRKGTCRPEKRRLINGTMRIIETFKATIPIPFNEHVRKEDNDRGRRMDRRK